MSTGRPSRTTWGPWGPLTSRVRCSGPDRASSESRALISFTRGKIRGAADGSAVAPDRRALLRERADGLPEIRRGEARLAELDQLRLDLRVEGRPGGEHR